MIDLGCNVKIEFLAGRNGLPIGLILEHVRLGGRRKCRYNGVLFDLPEVRKTFPGRTMWRIHSRPGEPLTVWPSMRCPLCGRHGWITNGQWVPDD